MGAEVVADDREADVGRVEGAQVAAELQEPGAGLARLDVPIQFVLAQLVGGEQVPDPAGAMVGARIRGRSWRQPVGPSPSVWEVPRSPVVGQARGSQGRNLSRRRFFVMLAFPDSARELVG